MSAGVAASRCSTGVREMVGALALTTVVMATAGCELFVDASDYAIDGSSEPGGTTTSTGASGGVVTECPAGTSRVEGGPTGAFCIDTFEVDSASMSDCLAKKGCPALANPGGGGAFCKSSDPTFPANCVPWEQATAFCEQLGRRLPTDVEWKFAAMGPQGFLYPWGNAKPTDQPCWKRGDFDATGKYQTALGPCPLAANPKDLSPFGVRNLGGNVAEWTSVPGVKVGEHLVFGGWWENSGGLDSQFPDSTTYSLSTPSYEDTVGFRCVVSLAP